MTGRGSESGSLPATHSEGESVIRGTAIGRQIDVSFCRLLLAAEQCSNHIRGKLPVSE